MLRSGKIFCGAPRDLSLLLLRQNIAGQNQFSESCFISSQARLNKRGILGRCAPGGRAHGRAGVAIARR
jgi:hypothetical protein